MENDSRTHHHTSLEELGVRHGDLERVGGEGEAGAG